MSTASCPLCGETYLSAATVCADCRVALVLDPLDPLDQEHEGEPDPEVGDESGRGTADEAGGDVEATASPGLAEGDWPEGDDEVGYELDDWPQQDRDALTAALRSERIAHEWRDGEVVVPERWADVAEELIDAIDHPDALDAEDDVADDGGAELLSALYVATDILSGDPGASGAVIEVLELAPTLAASSPPYGVDGGTWASVREQVATIAELLEADEDDDEVRAAAASVRGLLRPLV